MQVMRAMAAIHASHGYESCEPWESMRLKSSLTHDCQGRKQRKHWGRQRVSGSWKSPVQLDDTKDEEMVKLSKTAGINVRTGGTDWITAPQFWQFSGKTLMIRAKALGINYFIHCGFCNTTERSILKFQSLCCQSADSWQFFTVWTILEIFWK